MPEEFVTPVVCAPTWGERPSKWRAGNTENSPDDDVGWVYLQQSPSATTPERSCTTESHCRSSRIFWMNFLNEQKSPLCCASFQVLRPQRSPKHEGSHSRRQNVTLRERKNESSPAPDAMRSSAVICSAVSPPRKRKTVKLLIVSKVAQHER